MYTFFGKSYILQIMHYNLNILFYIHVYRWAYVNIHTCIMSYTILSNSTPVPPGSHPPSLVLYFYLPSSSVGTLAPGLSTPLVLAQSHRSQNGFRIVTHAPGRSQPTESARFVVRLVLPQTEDVQSKDGVHIHVN